MYRICFQRSRIWRLRQRQAIVYVKNMSNQIELWTIKINSLLINQNKKKTKKKKKYNVSLALQFMQSIQHLKSKFPCQLCVQFSWHSHFPHFQIFVDRSQNYSFTALTLKRVTSRFNKTIVAHYYKTWTAKNYNDICFIWNRIFKVLLFQFYHASLHPFFSQFDLIVAPFELFMFFMYAIFFVHSAFFKSL